MLKFSEYLRQFPINISDQNELNSLKFYLADISNEGSPGDALALADFISETLAKQGQALSQQNPALYGQYEEIWAQAVAWGFAALSENDQTSLLQTKLLFMLQHGVDFSDFIRKFYDYGYDFEMVKAVAAKLVKALMANTENLGEQPIIVDGKKIFPQLKNWIYDYSRFPSAVARRGSLERLNYVNKSQNTRAFTQAQRQLLLEALKIYDDLLNADNIVRDSALSYDDKTGVLTSNAAPQRARPNPLPQPSPGQMQVRRQSIPVPQNQPTMRPQPLRAALQQEQLSAALRQNQGIDIEKKLDDLKQRTTK